MKKLYFVLCMAFCMVALSACGKSKKSDNKDKFDEKTIQSTYQTTVQGLSGEDLSAIEEEDTYNNYVKQNGEELAQSILAFHNTTKDLGKFESVDNVKTTYADGKATVEGRAKYEKDTVIIRMVFKSTSEVESFSSDVYRTLGQKMINALLNTLLGMGTVFAVLIFISLIIGLLKYVPQLVSGKPAKKEQQVETTVVSAPTLVEEEEEEEVDDVEVIAVVTAAIMASLGEEAPADGLVVKSIRKVNRKWKNA